MGPLLINHRITEWQGLEGTSGDPPPQPPAQAGSPTAGCTAPRPGGAGISPEKETPQPRWAAWARAPSPSEGRSSSSCSAGASSASVCARCPLSCRWAPLESVAHPPDPHPADIYKIPSQSSSPACFESDAGEAAIERRRKMRVCLLFQVLISENCIFPFTLDLKTKTLTF